MRGKPFYIVNSISWYRLLVTPLLLYLIFTHQIDVFKWLLGFSFFTDLIDGMLARKFKVASTMGARLDSLADDFTVFSGIIGLFILKPGFIQQEIILILILFLFYLVQAGLAIWRYNKLSSFHTYLAKAAALFQGSFLILMFFLPQWPLGLFYIAVAVTILDLIEETILVLVLDTWQTDVGGLYWIARKRKSINH